ncbi:hypothetical protein GQ457_12G020580 [Hibiscus cannabinus]
MNLMDCVESKFVSFAGKTNASTISVSTIVGTLWICLDMGMLYLQLPFSVICSFFRPCLSKYMPESFIFSAVPSGGTSETSNSGRRKRTPEENVSDFQELICGFFRSVPPWIMTSSVTNQSRDEILLHTVQLRNYWLKH